VTLGPVRRRQRGEGKIAALAAGAAGTTSAARRGQVRNLPAEISTFVGRKREMADVMLQLGSARLITLGGTGGVGKSRLAMRIAHAVHHRYAGGVWFLQLDALSQPALLPHVMMVDLGLPEDPRRTAVQSLVDFLRPRRSLLVLDNCEHLIDVCAPLTKQLLVECPFLTVLATSREALRISGEVTFVVPPLAVPAHQDLVAVGDPDELSRRFDAVELFVKRAASVCPGFALTGQNAAVVGQICASLDGVPLALELAAARVRILSVQQIAARLNQRFSLLVSRSLTAPPRQRALQATFDWSYDSLPPAEKALFREISVFAGDWSLEAAEAVVGGDVTDMLGNLVDKSLLLASESNGEMRYRLLETARQYSLSRLIEAGEDAMYQHRHLEWCLSIAQRAERDYWTADQWTSCAHVEHEFENIRAAFEWACADVDRADAGIDLAGTLWHFWDLMGHLQECRDILRHLLSVSAQRTATRAKALAVFGWLPVPLGEGPPDEAALSESIELSRELGLTGLAALSLGGLAHALLARSELAAAGRTQAEALRLAQEAGDATARWVALEAGAVIARATGDCERALPLLRQARAVAIEQRDDYARARVEAPLVRLHIARGQFDAAQSICAERLRDGVGLRDIQFLLEVLGWIASARGDAERAATLLSAAHSARDRSGVRLFFIDDLEEHERAMARLGQLDPGEFERLWSAAQTAPEADLLVDALSRPVGQQRRTPPPGPDRLTGRELQILRLIAQGSSNRDIASQLGLSVRTVERHITNVYAKIDARGKADATAYAFRRGLVAS
jgi:non-specific serine/threonine protein kinase